MGQRAAPRVGTRRSLAACRSYRLQILGPSRRTRCLGDTLALFCLGVQKYKALLVLAEQLGYGHIFDSRGHRSRTVFSGDHGVQWDRHRRGPAGTVVCTSAAPVDVVDVLDARFREAPQVFSWTSTPPSTFVRVALPPRAREANNATPSAPSREVLGNEL
jgi:hypothetical protein